MKRTYHRFIGSAAVMLGALVAVMIVSGGWQAVAAALGILAGLVFVLSFIILGVASERPTPTRPAWARETERGRPAPAVRPAPAAAPRRAPVPAARGRLSSAPS